MLIHIIECRFRNLKGEQIRFIAEREIRDTDFDSTLEDIYHGQVENVIRVDAIDRKANTCKDVSAVFATAIIRLARSRMETIGGGVLDFVEEHAGLQRANLVRAE